MENKERIFILSIILIGVVVFFGAIITAVNHNVKNGFKVPLRKDVAYYQARDSQFTELLNMTLKIVEIQNEQMEYQDLQDSFILEMRRDLDKIISHK